MRRICGGPPPFPPLAASPCGPLPIRARAPVRGPVCQMLATFVSSRAHADTGRGKTREEHAEPARRVRRVLEFRRAHVPLAGARLAPLEEHAAGPAPDVRG